MEAAVKGNSTSHENVSKENVSEAIEKMNDFLAPTRRNLKFELHDKLDKYYVSVVDSNTDEVIKEIPPKKFLDMYAAMAEYMGILVDQKI
jgi:flagellar protein FlaG